MISGPNGIYICDECISVCADAMMRDLGLHLPQDDGPLRRYVPGHASQGTARHARHGASRHADAPVPDAPDPATVLGSLPTPHELYSEPLRARGGAGRGQARPFGGRVQPLQAHQPGRGGRRGRTWSWPRATSCCWAPPAPARRFWPRRSPARCRCRSPSRMPPR